ncbi:MAG: DNA gyrase inhibitor YacG [Pseudobdellovibrionaceae bacterium]
MTRIVRCPRCGGPASFESQNTYRPFCSERCKLIDLGKWASEDYKIPIENQTPNDFDEDIQQEQSETTQEDKNKHN